MEQLPVLYELATAFHTCLNTDSLLKTFSSNLASRLKVQAVLVWLLAAEGEELICRSAWFAPGVRFQPARAVADGLLAEMVSSPRGRRLAGQAVNPSALTHLDKNDRERVKTALYAPLLGSRGALGVVELLNKTGGEFTADEAALIEEAARLTGRALEAHLAGEAEQSGQMATIQRLSDLYDISRVFNSTLELAELLPVVGDRIRVILEAQACNIWLVDSASEELYFAQQVGDDPTTLETDRLPLGEGLIGDVARKGEARLVTQAAEEPLLAERQQRSQEFVLESLMVAPLMKEESVLGVIEVVNKNEGGAFDDDDLFFLTSITEQAAIALHNANLLEAERKVHELDALLTISKEITSTLNLDHVLTTVVHQAATIVPFDRCVIGLFDRNRFILGAVSGEAEVPKTREMEELRAVLEDIAEQTEAVKADNYDEGWQVTPAEGQEQLTDYLGSHGSNGFYALPLRDEQGTVGVLALLSGDAEFLSENHLEVISILANQTTVAIRNARLYQEVPLMSLWQPLVEKKRKLMAVPHARWLELGWKVGLVALVLMVVPWKVRIGTTASVVPAERRVVTTGVQGVIQRVLVHEGQHVVAGQALAQLDDSDNRVALDRAQSDLALAQRDQAQAEANRDLGAAAQAHLRVEMHEAETQLYRVKVEKAQLRSLIDGVVVTPKVEEKTGQLLNEGDTFCELVDPRELAVEMDVPETDVDLVAPGKPVAIKLNAYPTRTFSGTVQRVSAQTRAADGNQYFVVRAVFPNPEAEARAGMVGRAKITATGGWFHSGWYPVGYAVLRTPARWAWRKAWSWLP